MIVKAAIVFGAVLLLMPHEIDGPGKSGEAAPVSGVLSSLRAALLTDVAQVRADIAESQRERGGGILDRI